MAAKLLSVAEVADLTGASAGTVRSWARDGFPGATVATSSKNRPMWQFDPKVVKPFAAAIQKANAIFKVVGR